MTPSLYSRSSALQSRADSQRGSVSAQIYLSFSFLRFSLSGRGSFPFHSTSNSIIEQSSFMPYVGNAGIEISGIAVIPAVACWLPFRSVYRGDGKLLLANPMHPLRSFGKRPTQIYIGIRL